MLHLWQVVAELFERQGKVGTALRIVHVEGRFDAGKAALTDDPGAIDEFTRRWNDIYAPHLSANPGRSRPGANDFEAELWKAIAERVERQVFKHDVGRAAESWNLPRPFNGLDQRIRQLISVTLVEAIVEARERQRFAIGPDTVNAGDRPFCNGDSEAHRIGIVCDFRSAFSSAPLAALFPETGRPDELSTDPHASIDAGHWRPFPAFHDMQRFDTRPFNGGHQGSINGTTSQTAERSPDQRPGKLCTGQTDAVWEQRATCRAADLRENDFPHSSVLQSRK